MLKKTKVLQVADYFILKNNKNPKPDFTNKKLQKLLYYSQAWNLVINNKKLFDDKIEAWIHGPSVPIVYLEFKKFGYNEIKQDVKESDFPDISTEEKNVLDSIWNVYGKYDANYLEALSHSEEPWQKTRAGLMSYESSSAEITIEEMKSYYEQKSKQ
ncbi:MAG: type II toxin-antitoxin system antitoxin SocA domain-containing protein [bacterium]